MTEAPTTRNCDHCEQPMQGFAFLYEDGKQKWLCHHDEQASDCYVLVTRYEHPLPCSCRKGRAE